jgi:diacylglycerol kinase
MWVDFKKLENSLNFALSGIKDIIREENSFRFELIVAVAVAAAAFCFPLSPLEKAVIFMVVFSVLIAEIINTVAERMMDVYSTDHDPRIKKIKDMCSGAVLLTCLMAGIVGLIIFLK